MLMNFNKCKDIKKRQQDYMTTRLHDNKFFSTIEFTNS